MVNEIPPYFFKKSSGSVEESFFDILNVKNDKFLEVEARLGIILDKKSNCRIDLGTSHPIIFSTAKSEFYFQSGVSSEFFENVLKKFSTVDLKSLEETVVVKNNLRTIYSGNCKTTMKKIRLKTFEIHFPKCKYDVRISFSKEEAIKVNEGEKSNSFAIEGFRRQRNRASLDTKFYRFDFTKVRSSNNFTNEVEVEILDFSFNRNEFFNILKNIAE